MTTPLYSNAMLREINEGVETEIKYAGWGKTQETDIALSSINRVYV